MGDILTQIQDELDMLLNQMARGLQHIKERAPPSAPNNQPLLSSFAEYEASQNPSQPTQSTDPSQPPPPSLESQTVSPAQLQADIKELSRDLVVKEQQLELLINRLPGIGSSEKEQVDRMRELEKQLEDVEGDRRQAVKEKEALVGKVEEKIMAVSGF